MAGTIMKDIESMMRISNVLFLRIAHSRTLQNSYLIRPNFFVGIYVELYNGYSRQNITNRFMIYLISEQSHIPKSLERIEVSDTS